MEEAQYELQFVRKTSLNGVHWELRYVKPGTDEGKTFSIQGFPMSWKYTEKVQTGSGQSAALISNLTICKINERSAQVVANVAATTKVITHDANEYARMKAQGKIPWCCQHWTVDVLTGLEAKGIVDRGVSQKIATHIGEKDADDNGMWL